MYQNGFKGKGEIYRVDVKINLWLLCICVFLLFVSSSLHAKTEVLFSPRGSIKDKILENINSSKKTIDIAAFIFTAGELAEALYKAKERGVGIRIIVDLRQMEKRYPALEFLNEGGFDLQFLTGNIGGVMNNTFAIFDGKTVVSGSYNWTEYAEKFNYENALFIDGPDVVKRFQEEFESLYSKSKIMKEKRMVEEQGPHTRLSKLNKIEETPTSLNSVKLEKRGNGKEDTPVTDEVSKRTDVFEGKVQVVPADGALKDFVDISFVDFDEIFGKESKLKKSERKQIWKDKFEGKYVKWTGSVSSKGVAVYDWNKVGIRHKSSDIDVLLRFDWTKQNEVRRLKIGDVVTYTGRLVSLRSFLSPYRLDYAVIIEWK